MALIKKEVLVIAGIEIAFGIIEGILVPNFVEQKLGKGWKFKLPPRDTILKTAIVLFITGTLSGMLADFVIQKTIGEDDMKMAALNAEGRVAAMNKRKKTR